MSVNETIIKDIFALVKDLKFGEVIIKIQDSRIVQIERLEKFRVDKTDFKIEEANRKIVLKTNQTPGGRSDV